MPNSFQQYFSQRVKYTFNNLYAIQLNADEPALHDLRVEMKKMRAIIRFLREVYPKQKLKKAAGRFKQVFHEAGEIRELQLLHQWLDKNGIKSFYTEYFPGHEIIDLVKGFSNRSGQVKSVLKDAIEKIEKFVQATNQILAEQYLVELHVQLKHMITQQPGTQEWHELRKLIKQWLYAINWLGKQEKRNFETDIPYFTKLQEAIGYWHDIEIIREMLQQKKIHLSQSMDVQKDLVKANQKLLQSMRYRERQIGEMLAQKELISSH